MTKNTFLFIVFMQLYGWDTYNKVTRQTVTEITNQYSFNEHLQA